MLDHGGFNHNAHSLRIVTELERRYPDFPGLNLSYEVLEGMVKHETDYDVSDAKDYDPDLRGSLEAQIANVADELAYTSHDLDDGLRSGMITPSQLDGIAIWEIINESLGRRKSETLDELARHQIIRRLIGFETTDLIQSIDRYLRKSNVKSALELQKLPYNVVGFSEDMFRRNRELKDFLFNNPLPSLSCSAHGQQGRKNRHRTLYHLSTKFGHFAESYPAQHPRKRSGAFNL